MVVSPITDYLPPCPTCGSPRCIQSIQKSALISYTGTDQAADSSLRISKEHAADTTANSHNGEALCFPGSYGVTSLALTEKCHEIERQLQKITTKDCSLFLTIRELLAFL